MTVTTYAAEGGAARTRDWAVVAAVCGFAHLALEFSCSITITESRPYGVRAQHVDFGSGEFVIGVDEPMLRALPGVAFLPMKPINMLRPDPI